MKKCRICDSILGEPIFSSAGPSTTSIRTILNNSLYVFLCPKCLHVQKPCLPNFSEFYDKEYRISLQSEDFDQIYDVIDGKAIYRTEFQAEIMSKMLPIPPCSKVLDFGAGKAGTLHKLSITRPDVIPYVFDVSDDYRKFWDLFVNIENQATHKIPETWNGSFYIITAHFVLEHTEDPCTLLSDISKLLSPEGFLYFTVPDIINNPGDMLPIDHINHYSIRSIRFALENANMSLVTIERDLFRGAFIVVAKHKEVNNKLLQEDLITKNQFLTIATYWSEFENKVSLASQGFANRPTAIFGAGVYGTYIASRIMHQVNCLCFLDNSPHLHGTIHMGIPVISPSSIPDDIEIIYAGLHPSIAREVIEPLRTNKINLIHYFDL